MTDAVPEAWLRDEHTEAADRFDRLAGDAETVAALRAADFAGPYYEHFEYECARYGLAVIGGWVRRGLMYEKCQRRGVRGVPHIPDAALRDEHAFEELALETVRRALIAFRDKVLIPGVWDSGKGASLRTFFIGQCLFQYANVATAFLRVHRRELELRESMTRHFDSLAAASVSSLEDDVIRSEIARHALSDIGDERLQTALLMTAWKYTQAEIAEYLGVSPKAVERKLANYRRKLGKEGIA